MAISFPSAGNRPVGADVTTTVQPTTDYVVVAAANPNRAPDCLIINNTTGVMWVSFTGTVATTAAPSIPIPANGGALDIPGTYTGVVLATWAAAATGTAVCHQFSYN